jgi:D-galactose 1-dehydrogenase
MSRIKLAIVGLGKIARDQHIPACTANADFELVAVASPHDKLAGVPSFPSIAELLEAVPAVTAVALCTPPQVRYEIARYALEHGKHVLLEKPPGVTMGEIQDLVELALSQGVSLFAAWHSRHAPAVEPARAWLERRRLRGVRVTWKEDVRVWHPGQRWIWQPGGLGVFDPGINALSILTHIIPGIYRLCAADLSYPANCDTPIAAHLLLVGPNDDVVTFVDALAFNCFCLAAMNIVTCKPQQQVVPQAKKAFPCATWVRGLRNTLAARHRAEAG